MKATHPSRTILAVLLVLALSGCMTHHHVVGAGPGDDPTQQTTTQWYALWGLVPLNEVDEETLVAGATDYEIVTEMSPLDAIINFFTTYVSILRRSVTVIR